MAKKITDLSAATTPLAGTEMIEIVQSGTSKKADVASLTGISIYLALNTQTASYTLVLGDVAKYVRMNVATANNLTVPLNSSVAFPTGTQIHIRQAGAGQTTVVETVGVTITSPETLKLRKQHSTATLVKVGTDAWELLGDLEAI